MITYQTDNLTALTSSSKLVPGVYQHYKGKYYLILFTCQHTETQEEFVIYQTLYDNFKVWARPLTMFTEDIDYNGAAQPRFKYAANSSEAEKFMKIGKTNV
jgi:hypothetical protein